MTEQLLRLDNLSVAFDTPKGLSEVVHGVSFEIAAGEKLALVGESGSGKSVTAQSILRLHDERRTHYPQGRILFQGEDLLQRAEPAMRSVRGRDIGMIFQEPMTSLNPVYPIGAQLMEPLVQHLGMGRQAARERAIELLELTGIPDPGRRIDAFPHMLSGGQRQRVMIAMALACRPKLLIADEPTTALDVTIQAQILDLLDELQAQFDMAVLMITHDLNLVRRFADRVCVMQQGELVEQGTTGALFESPQHPYTRQLLEAEPRRLLEERAPESEPLLRARDLRCHFPIYKSGLIRRRVGEVKAVDDVSLDIRPGETVGLVGESGSGKSTLGMSLLRLQSAEGEILFQGEDLQALNKRQLRPCRADLQVVFQDPYSSLSPRMNIEEIVGEGLRVHAPGLSREQRRERIVATFEEVGLDEDILWRYPHEFSGGQRQRIAIARAVVLRPKLILLDEPTSALDVSVQKQVLELLHDLQRKHGISYLFISHDLRVIRAVSHRLLVMKDGRVVESGETEQVFNHPRHPYTHRLLSASLLRPEAAA